MSESQALKAVGQFNSKIININSDNLDAAVKFELIGDLNGDGVNEL